MLHRNTTFIDGHVIHAWEVADTIALNALVVVAADVGKVARKLDTNTFHILLTTAPTWLELGTGGGSGSPLISLVAATDLIAFKVLTSDATGKATYADAGTLAHAGRVIGVGTVASLTGGSVTIAEDGVLSNAGWAWSPGVPLYLGISGDIVTTQVGVFSVQIGYAITATSIQVNIGNSIIRS